jgi:hypothetical protein
MVPSIANVLSGFKRNWTEVISYKELESFFRAEGLKWRDRVLTPARTIQLMLLQVLHGNTAINHLRHLSDLNFTAGAYCQARQRLPLEILEKLRQQINAKLESEDLKQGVSGPRIFLLDGSAVSMPDEEELQKEFPQPGRQRKGCGFPVAKVIALFHLGTGMLVDFVCRPLRTHDISCIEALHRYLAAGDILVADRAYCAYSHFISLIRLQVDAIIRKHQRIITDFKLRREHQINGGKYGYIYGVPRSKLIKAIGKEDQIIQWFKPKSKPKSITKEEYLALPDSITIRELRYEIVAPGFRSSEIVIFTTLVDEVQYPSAKIAEIYGLRWEIETNFNHLKTTLKMDILKTKSVDNIQRELIAYCIIYNLVRLVMIEAAVKLNLPLKRISFCDAARWLLESLFEVRPLNIIVLPIRPGRREPRVKKRREKPYPYMIKPRAELKVMLKNQQLKA